MVFDEIAEAYDLLADPARRIEREGPLLASWAGEGPIRVLDLACGTGAHAAFLAGRGAEVTACDLSEEMIRVARRERGGPRVTYEVGDLRRPPAGPFDRVLLLGNSLNLLGDEGEVARALGAIRAVLAPGGRLLVQVLNPEAPAQAAPKLTWRSGRIRGREAVVVKSLVPHGGRRYLTLSACILGGSEVGRGAGGAVRGVLLDLDAAALERLLGGAGFGEVRLLGGMDGSPFDAASSPDIVADARAGKPSMR